MLTYDDNPTIRWAIIRRMDKEPGIKVCDVVVKEHSGPQGPEIAVGALFLLDDTLVVKSRFNLPQEFTHSHLVNEIDQMCEQCKAARADYWAKGRTLSEPEKILSGTGLRGLWPKELPKSSSQVGAGS